MLADTTIAPISRQEAAARVAKRLRLDSTESGLRPPDTVRAHQCLPTHQATSSAAAVARAAVRLNPFEGPVGSSCSFALPNDLRIRRSALPICWPHLERGRAVGCMPVLGGTHRSLRGLAPTHNCCLRQRTFDSVPHTNDLCWRDVNLHGPSPRGWYFSTCIPRGGVECRAEGHTVARQLACDSCIPIERCGFIRGEKSTGSGLYPWPNLPPPSRGHPHRLVAQRFGGIPSDNRSRAAKVHPGA